MDSSNYAVEVVARSSANAYGIGPAARCAASSAVTYYAYVLFGGDAAYLVEITAGGENILDTGAAISANTNYTLRLEVEGTTIRGYRNGTLDVSVTDASLSSGAPGIMAYGGGDAGTYITTWTATDLASGTTYTQAVAGSLASAGVVVKRANKILGGALTLAGTVAKRTGRTVAGALTLAGTVAIARMTLASVGGALTLAGTVAKRTGRTVAGALTVAGTVAKRTGRTVAGALTLAGTVATEKLGGVIEQAVGGALTLAGTVTRQTNKALGDALTLAGTVAKRTGRTLAGALTLVGTVIGAWFRPVKLDVWLSDAAQTSLAIGDAAQTSLVIGDATQTSLAIRDTAQTSLAIGDAAQTSLVIGDAAL
jgi:hypothetical protein